MEGQRVGRVRKEGEVCDELVLGGYLQVVAGLGLSITHGVFLHAHECGRGIGLGDGIATFHLFQAAVIFR